MVRVEAVAGLGRGRDGSRTGRLSTGAATAQPSTVAASPPLPAAQPLPRPGAAPPGGRGDCPRPSWSPPGHQQLPGAPPPAPLLERPHRIHRPVHPAHQPGAAVSSPQSISPAKPVRTVSSALMWTLAARGCILHLKSASSSGMLGSDAPRYSHTGQALFIFLTPSSQRLTRSTRPYSPIEVRPQNCSRRMPR